MTVRQEYEAALGPMGLEQNDVPNILAAVDFSTEHIAKLRSLVGGYTRDDATAVALGSLGRFEASSASDVDLAVVYDESRVTPATAAEWKRALSAPLIDAKYDVSQKTFAEPRAVGDIRKDVGGPNELNAILTFRTLFLTEAAWLAGKAASEDFRDRIFSVYQHGRKTRGRFISSLSNDLHRYYRTLCVDYRYKVEVEKKGWAIRNIKLRHSRKVWHLANLAVQCRASMIDDEEEHDAYAIQQLGRPPLLKIATALKDCEATEKCRALYLGYDRFLGFMKNPATRTALEDPELTHENKDASREFQTARESAEKLHEATAEIVDSLYASPATRTYLVRYGLL